MLEIPGRPPGPERFDVPGILGIDELEPHHPVVKTLRVAAPGNPKVPQLALARHFHRHKISRFQVESSMDSRTALIDGNNGRPVEKVAPLAVLAAQDDGDKNWMPVALPSVAHEVNRTYSPPHCGVKIGGRRSTPTRARIQLLPDLSSQKKPMIVEPPVRVNGYDGVPQGILPGTGQPRATPLGGKRNSAAPDSWKFRPAIFGRLRIPAG